MRPYNEFSSTRGYCNSKPVPIINPITLQIVVDNDDSLEGLHPTEGQVMGFDGENVVWGKFEGIIPTLQKVLDAGNYANQSITLGDDVSGSATITNKITDSGLVVTDDNLISNIGIQLIHDGLVFSRKNEQTPLTVKVSDTNTVNGTIRYTKMDASLLNNGVECYFKNNVEENKAFLSQTELAFDTSLNGINSSTYYKNDGFSIYQTATNHEIKADVSDTSFTISDNSGSFIATPSSMKVGGTTYFEVSANTFLQMSLSGDTGTSGQIITHDGSGVVWGDLPTIESAKTTTITDISSVGPWYPTFVNGLIGDLSHNVNSGFSYDASDNAIKLKTGTEENLITYRQQQFTNNTNGHTTTMNVDSHTIAIGSKKNVSTVDSIKIEDGSNNFIATPTSMKVGGTKYFEVSANTFLQMSLSGDTGTAGYSLVSGGAGDVSWSSIKDTINLQNVLDVGSSATDRTIVLQGASSNTNTSVSHTGVGIQNITGPITKGTDLYMDGLIVKTTDVSSTFQESKVESGIITISDTTIPTTTTYRTDGITQLNTGVTSNNFTISSDKNINITSENFTVNNNSMVVPKIGAAVNAQVTELGMTCNDSTRSAYYRSTGLSMTEAGNNTSLFANRTSLTYTNSAGTGTGSLSSDSLTFIGPNSTSSLYNLGYARISSTTSTGSSNPILTLENSTAGSLAGVSIETYKNGGAGVNGDEIFRLSMNGKNAGNTKAEYGRITTFIRDSTTPSAGVDGAIIFSVAVNNQTLPFLDLNGNSNRVNCLRQLNIQNHDIISSSADIHLNASNSTGTGRVILEPKVNSYIIMNNLPTSSAGLPTGAVWRNGNVLNIV